MAPHLGLKGRRLRAAIWTEALFAIAIFGYSGAAAGGVLNMASFRKQFPSIDVMDAPESEKHHKSTIQGTVVATYVLLGVPGALACLFFGDTLGRRWSIFVAASLQLIGAILQGTSYSLGQFIVGRVFLGLSVGALTATVPAWQSELSKTESRGSHVSSFGIYCGVGLSMALWISLGMSFASGSVAWRLSISFSGVLAIIVMSTIFMLPESPRWYRPSPARSLPLPSDADKVIYRLKLKGRHEEARQILELLHPGDQELIEKELEDIELALKASTNQASLMSMFSMGPQRIFHRVMLASVVQIMLQMTGVNAIAFYANTIYEESLGFPRVEAGALAAASQGCIVLGGIICFFTVERFGRRTLMMVSGAGMSICFACVTGLVSQSENSGALKAAVFFLYLYYVVYTLGFIGIPFLYASEIAPVQLRAPVCGLSTAVSWLFNFMVVEITPVGFQDISYRYFIIYCVACATFVPIVYFFYPETAGRSLEEIDMIFTQSKSIFDTVSVARHLPKGHVAELEQRLGHSNHHEAVKARNVEMAEDVEEAEDFKKAEDV